MFKIHNRKIDIVLLQLSGCKDKVANIENAILHIRKAVKQYKPKIIALPECFNSPYGTEYFDDYAEYVPEGYTSVHLSSIAKELNVYIIGGTIPERDPIAKKILYNTCPIFSPTGDLIGKYRKVHMFDVDIKNQFKFCESSALTPGKDLTIIEIEGIKIGIGICADVYFEEFIKLYRKADCKIMIIPSAFPEYLGRLHWHLHNRSRASDNQMFLATISPATDEKAEYVAYGHTMFVDPWGQVMASAGAKEEMIYASIDIDEVERCREQMQIFYQRRLDIYDTLNKKL